MRDLQAESGSSKIGSRLDNSLDDTGYGWKPPSAACPLLTKRKSTSSRRRGPARVGGPTVPLPSTQTRHDWLTSEGRRP